MPLRTSGGLWGPIRVRLGISMSELHRRTGIPMPVLSLIEQGRVVPTGEEFRLVWKVLREPRPSTGDVPDEDSEQG